MDSSFVGKDSFVWWKGVVEDRKDPIMLGRVKVRIFGHHSEDPQQVPTEDLPWASISTPADTGRNPVGLKEGDWVWGFFMDGESGQWPIVVGLIPGIDEKPKAPELGFGDPTKPEDIKPDSFPRPPDITAQTTPDDSSTSGSSDNQTPGGRFYNTDRVPGSNIAFGELCKYYDPLQCKFDLNGDGVFNLKDALIMIRASSGLFGKKVFDGLGFINTISGGWIDRVLDGLGNIKIRTDAVPPAPTTSPYPLVDRLMEPTTSRLARNENIDNTIVGLKKGTSASITTAGFDDAGVAGQAPAESGVFDEPETPYDAKYPYNHVYESESGHFIEIDDTPGAERLHWYHRSGTFREIHPDGTQVTKVKKCDYNFVVEDYFCGAEKTLNLSSKKDLKVKSDEKIVLQTGSSFNRQVGEDENVSVDGDTNTRVKGSTHKVIDEELWTHVNSGAYLYVKDGDVHIKSKNKVLIDADGPIQLRSKDSIKFCAPKITLQGTGGGLTDINLVSISIRSLFLQAHTALAAGVAGWVWPFMPYDMLIPDFAFPVGREANNADKDDWYKETTEDSSKKEGFVLPDVPDLQAVWKPVSDSDKKLVTLSKASGQHRLYEAIPTGVLEPVKIAYEHPDGQRTEWEIVRPVHRQGKEITNLFGPPRQDTFLDGRIMFRWPAPGKDYPKQLFFDAGNGILNFILDSAIRHQSSVSGFGPTDEDLNFDITKPGPEAGKEESGSASPKYGYLFPKGASGDVYKPTSDSNGNLVTLSSAGEVHELYEAIETDAEETVKIKYLNASQTITEWVVTRSIYRRGSLIESPSIRTMFEDGKRFMCRFSKPGSEYPKNMFLVIKKGGVPVIEHFIIDSGSRHQHTISYDDKVIKSAPDTVIDNASGPQDESNLDNSSKSDKKDKKNKRFRRASAETSEEREAERAANSKWSEEQRRKRPTHA